MKKLLTCAALVASIAIIPQLAMSAETSASMNNGPDGPMLCRPIRNKETASAQIIANKQELYCRNVDMKTWEAGPAGMSSMKSANEAHAAWLKFVREQFNLGNNTNLTGGGNN